MRTIKQFQDEREERNVTEALAKGALVAFFMVVLRIGYLLITGNAEFETVWWDLMILIAMLATYSFSLHRTKTTDIPKTLFGRELPTEMTSEAKKKRIWKNYIPNTIVFLIAFRIGSYFAVGLGDWPEETVLLIIQAAIFYPITYYMGEHRLKRYNQDLEE